MIALLSVYVIGSHLCVVGMNDGVGVAVGTSQGNIVGAGCEIPPILYAVVLVCKFLCLENRTQEEVLQLLVGEIDAELLEAIHLKNLEAEDVEQPDETGSSSVHA